MYFIQSLSTAARLRVGVVFIILNNGGYAVTDRLADARGGTAPWPSFAEVSVGAIAAGLSVESIRIDDYAELTTVLDRVAPSFGSRQAPLVVAVVVTPD